MKAVILAAGYATRLYPLTKDKPKPLAELSDTELKALAADRGIKIDGRWKRPRIEQALSEGS